MPEIVNPRIEEYLRQLYDDGDPVRLEMEEMGRQRKFPIVGPLVGRYLQVLTRSIRARRVFELGSGYGYSALRLAEGFLTRAGVWTRITYHREEATAALRRTGGTWDVVYNDIDKEGYPDTVDLAYAHLRPGGLFISDNVLWSGRVLEGESDGSPATKGIQEFTRRLLAHKGFLTAINPTRDGVSTSLRL